MIKIKAIQVGNFSQPEKELTTEEKKTVTSQLFNGVEYIYYQGDEPQVEPQQEVEPVVDLPLTDEQLVASFNSSKELGIIN